MSSMSRSSILVAAVLFALAPSALADPCPAPPYSVCEPFSVTGVWYSDASKTTVVGGWYHGCPNVNTCITPGNVWGERTAYSTVDCEPCTPCGNCLAKNTGDDEHEHDAQRVVTADMQDAAEMEAAQEEAERAAECGAR